MIAPGLSVVRTTFALGVGCMTAEAFLLQPTLLTSGVGGAASRIGIAAAPAPAPAPAPAAAVCFRGRDNRWPSVGVRVPARRATIATLWASPPQSRAEVGREEEREGKATPGGCKARKIRGGGGGGGGAVKSGLARRLSAGRLAKQLRKTVTTTLVAVLLLASTSTEQDIMTAMMGLDPSLAPTNNGKEISMTLSEGERSESNSQRGGSGSSSGSTEPPRLGSIDMTGQSSGAGEIVGGPGGGFKNGKLMVDETSDLAIMLGRKMKTPDAEPLTH